MVKVNGVKISKGRKRKLYGKLCSTITQLRRAIVITRTWREL